MDMGCLYEEALCEWNCFFSCVGLQIVREKRIEWPHPAKHREIDPRSKLVSRMDGVNKQSHMAKQEW